jgi:hypothetical protein
VSHFDHVLPVLGNASGVPATPGYLFALTAPPFNVHDPSSVFHPRERLFGSKKCARQMMSRSSGSVTQIGDSDRLLVPNEPCIARTPCYSHASAINVKQSSEQNIDIMGMDPPTPVIPEILIEADVGPTYESLQETAVMPCPESSRSAFRVAANDHDWDDETRVPEIIHGSQDKNHGEEDLSTSALLVEKLMGETEGIMSSVPRSWTLQISPVSFHLFLCICQSKADVFQGCREWEGSTLFKEPQELLSKYGSEREKVLRSSKSAESFLDMQRITSWLE